MPVAEAQSDMVSEPAIPMRDPGEGVPSSGGSSEYVDDMELNDSIIDALISEARGDLDEVNK